MPLLVVLGLGLAVRVLTTALYFPAIMTSFDSPRFARVGPTGLFDDFWMPAGYPLFLKLVHHVSDELWFSVALQHLIGLGTAAAVYAGVRRLGAPQLIALVPTAVLAFNGDLLFLEHSVMSDQFLFCFSVLACVALVHGLVPVVRGRWLAAAGALAMCAMLSRSVGLAVVAALAVVVLLLAPIAWRRRAVPVGSFLGGSAVVLGIYVVAFLAVGGTYLGLGDMRGWNLYSRVAGFADCTKFDPPAGTARLCETRPPSQRPGPFGYVWDLNSVPRRTFTPLGPKTGKPLGEFAETVLVHQPGDYLEAVGSDLVRYIEPSVGTNNGYNGQPRELVSFGFRDAGTEATVVGAMAMRYDGTRVSAPGGRFLNAYQQVVRIDRLTLLLAALLTLAGLVLARGAARIGVAAFGLTAFGLFLLPTMTVSYDFRYGIPPSALLSVSAVVAIWGIAARRRRTSEPEPEAREPDEVLSPVA